MYNIKHYFTTNNNNNNIGATAITNGYFDNIIDSNINN